ncbi:MAG: glycoside hydrolase family 127 protein [Treponema sp.]|nr:glycoside hydrolase family 127 protein [Treponema sp.]
MTNKEIIQKDLDDIYLGNLFTVETDLTLPKEGRGGSIFTWVSGFKNILSDEGKVTRPRPGSGNRIVSLTVTAGLDGVCLEKSFEVTVLEQPPRLSIVEVLPVILEIAMGEEYRLPTCVIVKKEAGVFGTVPVKWKDIPNFTSLEPGIYTVEGEALINRPDLIPEARISVLEKIEKPAQLNHVQKVQGFSLGEVKLLPGHFNDNRLRFEEFLLTCNDDQFLYNFRRASGLDPKDAPPMTGWDSPDGNLRGHTTGHYLSGLALAFAGGRENKERFKRKIDYMIDSLEECQNSLEVSGEYSPGFLSAYSEEQFNKLEEYEVYPKIWAPYYTLHKIMAGLLDCYEYGGNPKALVIAEKLGLWVHARLSKLPHAQLNKMWSMYIAGEYGGMNEVMARLFKISKKPEYIESAAFFENEKLFIPMAHNINTLCDIHANQHVPQIVGAFEVFRQTGDNRCYDIARNFWHFATDAHIFSLGGIGEGEMFKEPNSIAAYLTDKTAESCVSYNMLKLTGMLFQYDPNSNYMDYYERTLFNHIAGNGDPLGPTGGSTYFMPLLPGGKKSFDIQGNSCCHGTGLESHVKYQESIYFKQGNILYVNLYIPSIAEWKEKGIRIKQTGDFLKEQRTLFEIEGSGDLELRFRIPSWLNGKAVIKLNSFEIDYTMQEGYAGIRAGFKTGDIIEINFPFGFRLERAPDDPSIACLYYGPLVMVIEDERADFIELKIPGEDLSSIRQTGDLEFSFEGHKLIPLFLANNAPYHAYFKVSPV